MSVKKCLSYFNPCSSEFKDVRDASLTCCEKATAYLFACFACPFFVVGSCAAYRVTVRRILSNRVTRLPPVEHSKAQFSQDRKHLSELRNETVQEEEPSAVESPTPSESRSVNHSTYLAEIDKRHGDANV